LLGAHFPGVAVSASSTARTIRNVGGWSKVVTHAVGGCDHPAQKGIEMMLKDKVAVIYGAGGAIGGAVARAFAPEGADLFLTGRRWNLSTLSPGTSFPPADPPRQRRWTRSTRWLWTGIYSP
jgi:predicted amino acid dehydrogenase